MDRRVLTVAQINRYLKSLLSDDGLLSGFFVEGELSNFKAHPSGHWYFTLKDPVAAISCVMFRSQAQTVSFEPRDGRKVIIGGYTSLYEKTGQYQLYAEMMEPSGVGDLRTAFEQLRDRLRLEGLFDPARKRKIPAYVRCVAVVTSPTGAAVRDIVTTIRRRNPAVDIVIAPALVQGEHAAQDIARAIAEVNAWGRADVLIVGRGGGSIEDLWAFNEEVTVRAVAGSAIPTISAVGHETDFTITDFAADLRAPTPTAAAVYSTYDRNEALTQVASLARVMQKTVAGRIAENKKILAGLRPDRHIAHKLAQSKEKLHNRTVLLEKVSPYRLWRKGFALAQNGEGQTVASSGAVCVGDALTLTFADGRVTAAVTAIERSGEADGGAF